MPLETLAAKITSSGISAPSYAAILQSLQESFQAIYGSDVYISPDSQDGQLLALFASAINDSNQMAIAVYNSFRPSYSQGVALSSAVKINGIARKIPTFSTAVGNVVGVSGTIINNGIVSDVNGNRWFLPTPTTIPGGGSISVTVTAENPGAVIAPTGTINKIDTPVLGWQSFVSTSDATAGDPVETDAELRARQANAAALPSVTPLGGLLSALEALTGVTDVAVYENATGSADANGIPARSISVVIEGGTVSEIAEVIGQKKTPGAGTYGSTSQGYVDPFTGINYTINFYVLAYEAITVAISLDDLVGWNTNIENAIKQSVVDYINGLAIGQDVDITRLWAPAYLNGSPDSASFEITSLQINGGGADVVVAFNKRASCTVGSVTITVNP